MSFTHEDVPSNRTPLPVFEQPRYIKRPISTPEYYHACIGASRFTLERPREVICILRGVGWIEPKRWYHAIDRVVSVHPAVCLRIVGKRHAATFCSDGVPPKLRVLEHCDWDASTYNGAEFLWKYPLPLETGPTVELIVAHQTGNNSMLVLRGQHAVIDGSGALLLLRELFRALRGEPLQGSNVTYSDTDLSNWLGNPKTMQRIFKTVWLTGNHLEGEPGEELRRITLPSSTSNLLPRVAAAFASFAHQYSDKPAFFGIPIDLRRHVPGILTTMNFVNMIRIQMDKGDGPDVFQSRLKQFLSEKEEINTLPKLEWVKSLPLSWLDLLNSRNTWNYRRRRALETAVISYIGHGYVPHFCAPGFTSTDMIIMPQQGSAFATISKFGKRAEMMLNLPKVLASGGRFDALEKHLLKELNNR